MGYQYKIIKMKNRFKILSFSALILTLIFIVSCADDNVDAEIVSAGFTQTINQRSGTVTFINTSENATSYSWSFGDGTSSALINPVKTFDEGGTYTILLEVMDSKGNTASFEDVILIEEQFLLINGDFEEGATGWIQGVDDNVAAPTVTENGNTFYEVNITNPNPSQPFLVNLSQKTTIVQGETYILSFDAWSNGNRTLIAGIGLSGPTDFTNVVETIDITDTPQQFELILGAQEFGALDARVLFDSNGAAGLVRIDNVSLSIQ